MSPRRLSAALHAVDKLPATDRRRWRIEAAIMRARVRNATVHRLLHRADLHGASRACEPLAIALIPSRSIGSA